jgi:hypothetical protein
MRRPVFGAGSWHDETQRASLASYEAFTSLRFLTDGLGKLVESNESIGVVGTIQIISNLDFLCCQHWNEELRFLGSDSEREVD